MSSPAANIATAISTPTLDSESPALLQSITSHGGYAFTRMATLAAAGDQRAAEAACEMAWEQLHSGPWHSVLPVWRDAYSMACLHVAKFHLSNGEFRDALRSLDMGIIMGGPLLRKDLDSAIEGVLAAKSRHYHNEVADNDKEGHGEAGSRLLVSPQEFDKSEVLRILPIRSLSSKIVGKRSALSLEAFLCEYFLSGSPVIITDCMAHWPARTRWNDMDYLRRIAGDRTVPVEFSGNLVEQWNPSPGNRILNDHNGKKLQIFPLTDESFRERCSWVFGELNKLSSFIQQQNKKEFLYIHYYLKGRWVSVTH
ncbi:hypothetical protein ES319_A06G118800v1 [Gossypium barbadense]|uniref:Uncharacterized protein n=1 Tax=Gossypium barbadense TaxID=3634 RepID=A0A5J5VD40_GOSBA|nr:hypothetical protein ES319_A06G118800v1 [Gossypium barbadense]